ncbi:hypothetical protein VHEMI02866 [[Torrubiella] hemipterigena]|uniref:Translationally-controlled tumor protein homolog n=1 Tax=[Torrubiella] hemipterigena TaxID=1531966 RepID=A0A0A1TBQ9_9HYPO|nr:hypothetical protein VHEMI02866 [[Torrubiella] hemipterigena]
MKIFTDILSGDELLSDSFEPVLVDEVMWEADCAMITEGKVEVNTGANASAEEAAEDLDDTEVKVNNIVHSFRLQNTSFDKKSYQVHLKDYFKAIKGKLTEAGKSEDEIKAWQSKAQKYFVAKLGPNFKDLDFYTGESMDPEAMVVLLNYREDGVTPYVMVWDAGVKLQKV